MKRHFLYTIRLQFTVQERQMFSKRQADGKCAMLLEFKSYWEIFEILSFWDVSSHNSAQINCPFNWWIAVTSSERYWNKYLVWLPRTSGEASIPYYFTHSLKKKLRNYTFPNGITVKYAQKTGLKFDLDLPVLILASATITKSAHKLDSSCLFVFKWKPLTISFKKFSIHNSTQILLL